VADAIEHDETAMSKSKPSEASMPPLEALRPHQPQWLSTALLIGSSVVIIGCGLAGGLFFLTILFCQLAAREHQQEPQSVNPG
jgi:hypothetical protein